MADRVREKGGSAAAGLRRAGHGGGAGRCADFSEAIATLDGSTNTQIHSQVSGYLVKQAYTEGSVVKPGDLLFEIDPRPFQADLDKAKANLATAQAQLLDRNRTWTATRRW